MKRYNSILKECSCEDGKEQEKCPCAECEMKETCPEGTTPSGGGCKSKSGSTLSGKCDKGYTWDPDARKCISLSR